MVKAKRFCPYLGLPNDRDTCVSYPSLANSCFRNNKPARVLLEYQESYCLTDDYPKCPVYAGGGRVPLAKENQEPDIWKQRKIQTGIILGVVIVLLAVTGLVGYPYREDLLAYLRSFRAQPLPAPTYVAPTFALASAQAEVYQPQIMSTAQKKATRTAAVTETPQPNLTATPEGPENGNGFILHRIKGGENLDQLAETYYTSAAAILDINYKLTPPIPENRTIVIPEGIIKTNGYPQFEVKYIPEKTKVAFIVEKYDCNLALFQQYNRSIIVISLKVQYITSKQWVLIPRERAKKKSP